MQRQLIAFVLSAILILFTGCTEVSRPDDGKQPPPPTTSIPTTSPPTSSPPISTPPPPTTATGIDSDRDGIPDHIEAELASKFAPVVMLHPDDAYRPGDISWYLERVRMRFDVRMGIDEQLLNLGQVNITSLVSQATKGFSSGLSPARTDFFLEQTDASGGDNLDAFRSQTRSGTAAAGWECYVHVRPAPGMTGMIDVQYIFFYPYNGDLAPTDQLESAHEADFEHITVRLERGGSTIYRIFYSAHDTEGKWYGQATSAGARDGYSLSADGRPVAYSSIDSHASYPWAGTWVRNNLPDDFTSGNGPVWDCGVSVVNLGEKEFPSGNAVWIQYSGHWGEIGTVSFTTGPYGLAYQGWWELDR
ncbi:Vps62-related protein [Dehalogenimonas sp. THU2]|uniref:Vps62-related protein n=1 Tax=Dehalogenimonas sp. THU2 TaxID=3151121 RepID=UPI0032185F88